MYGLDPAAATRAAFTRRLKADSLSPLAVAVSGGGDSVALLAAAAVCSRRPLLVLTVDHGLQPDSAAWCARVLMLADRFGAKARVLRWEGPKPETGLPSAARAARHALLADAARAAGARVLLMGHTADDVEEGHAMRGQGVPLGRLREWGPSPAWPEGRGVFVLRPLLGCRRGTLREWLAARGLAWIEDPANEDEQSARVRARLALQTGELAGSFRLDEGATPQVGDFDASDMGYFSVPRAALEGADARRVLAASVSSASGQARRIRTDKADALLTRLRETEALSVVFGGAHVQARGDAVTFAREAGRGGLLAARLEAGRPLVWDGRFDLSTDAPGLMVTALAGHAAHLPEAERRVLAEVPALARPTLPLVAGPGVLTSPALAEGPVAVRSLVAERLSAALGAVVREP